MNIDYELVGNLLFLWRLTYFKTEVHLAPTCDTYMLGDDVSAKAFGFHNT